MIIKLFLAFLSYCISVAFLTYIGMKLVEWGIYEMIKHIRRWNLWRKYNRNSVLYKILVLFKVVESPSMMFVLLPEERLYIREAWLNAIYGGNEY